MALVADPRGDLPDAQREGARLGAYLGERPQYTVVVNDGAVSRAEFLARFRDSDIVHVAGQAEFDGARSAASGLLVADGRVTAADLGGLPAGATVPRLFFFNAIEPAAGGGDGRREAAVAAVAAAVLAAGVKHFVCSVRAVAGTTGFQFSDEFYHELASGRSVGVAVREARRAAARREGKSALTWASYVLYGDPTARYVTAHDATVLPGRRPRPRRSMLMAAGAAGAVLVAGALWLTFGGGTTRVRLDDAYTHLAAGRYEDAARGFQAAITARPAEAYEGLALVAIRQGDGAAAQRFCAAAQKIDARRPGCLLVQGDSVAMQGDLPKAAALYDSVISFAGVPPIPKSIAYNRLGRLSAAQGQPDKASAAYAKAQEADPSNAEAVSNAGALLRQQGRYAEATAAFEKAATLSPGDAIVQTLLSDTREAASLGKDQDKQKRVDALVDELAMRFKRGDVVRPPAGRDEWTSPPLTVSLLGLESRGRVAFREGEHDFLLLKIGQTLQAQTRARLVDRAVMDKLLGELKLGSSALADSRTALQLGRVLSARVISVGTIAGSGPEWTLTMRMIETESSAVVASVAQSFPTTQSSSQVADTVANDLAVKLRRAFPLRARVAGTGKGEVTLNVGSAEGAAVGQKLLILKDGERGTREAVAEVEIVEVSEHQSRARLSGEGPPVSRGQRAIERS
jgi:tetratricopeptide (TPR) repeat protein